MVVGIDASAPGRVTRFRPAWRKCMAMAGRPTSTIGAIGLQATNTIGYQYAREYVDILQLLWSQRNVNYEGEFFHLRDCRILPHPERTLPLVCAAQSDVGMQFTAQYTDYAFVLGDLSGEAVFAANRKLRQYAEETGRDVGAYVLYTLVLEETEAAAQAKSDYWMAHADREALAEMLGQAALNAAGGLSSA